MLTLEILKPQSLFFWDYIIKPKSRGAYKARLYLYWLNVAILAL